MWLLTLSCAFCAFLAFSVTAQVCFAVRPLTFNPSYKGFLGARLTSEKDIPTLLLLLLIINYYYYFYFYVCLLIISSSIITITVIIIL